MKKFIIAFSLFFLPFHAKADMWGGDLPLLAEIVFNTLHTMIELEEQSQHMKEELDGITDKIYRIQSIANVVQPSDWNKWKDPAEALRRLKFIYHTMPREYQSAKSDEIEDELSKAMNLVARIRPETETTFKSGKELEQRGADASPGVAQKLTASGVGTLIALESQTQVIQSHITSLLAQMIAEGNEKDTRAVVTRGSTFRDFSGSLSQSDNKFSTHILSYRTSQ
jgi:hypothetical protein